MTDYLIIGFLLLVWVAPPVLWIVKRCRRRPSNAAAPPAKFVWEDDEQ